MEGQSHSPKWEVLLSQALREPGKQAVYYGLFHRFSLGNQALAVSQMVERGIPVGPIASFNGWRRRGRRVKKGEKALALWMPVVIKTTTGAKGAAEGAEAEAEAVEEVQKKTVFIMKRNWFAMAQTEPAEPGSEVLPPPPPPKWDKGRALNTLGVTEVPFEHPDGNVQGFARPRAKQVAVSQIAVHPWKTLFHEVAHCLLHGEEEMSDGVRPDRSLAEAEAEAVAYLATASLGLPGLEESRWYIQNWLGGGQLPSKSAARIFAAADKILKAGMESAKEEGRAE